MAFGFLNRQRLWTVYAPTGNPSRPLKPVACVRANAKSIAAGKVVDLDPRLQRYNWPHMHVRKAKREALVVVEGCFAPGPVLRGASLRGASKKRRRRLTGEQIRAKLACKVFGGKACQ